MLAQAQAAYVLHSRAYKESSALVDLLTPHGRCRAVLRGARGAMELQHVTHAAAIVHADALQAGGREQEIEIDLEHLVHLVRVGDRDVAGIDPRHRALARSAADLVGRIQMMAATRAGVDST